MYGAVGGDAPPGGDRVRNAVPGWDLHGGHGIGPWRLPPGITATRLGGPIGFDGHYRVGGRMFYGPSACRGAWQDDGKTLVFETQTLGNDDVARATHVFTERTVEITIEGAVGYTLKLRGESEA